MFIWLLLASTAGAWIISPKQFELIENLASDCFGMSRSVTRSWRSSTPDCDALIAASFAEGFGLPIVEAGHFGKPVIASDIPVFREAGDGAVERRFFPVGSSAELAATVRTFVADPASKSSQHVANTGWPNWAQSAQELEDVVLGGNWYCNYRPTSERPYASLTDLGRVQMEGPLPLDKRAHRLERIEGPTPVDRGVNLKYVVRVSNFSDEVWSSAGPEGREMGSFWAIALRRQMARWFIPGIRVQQSPSFILPALHITPRSSFRPNGAIEAAHSSISR